MDLEHAYETTERSKASWATIIAIGWLGVVLTVAGIGSITEAVFSTGIAAPPRIEVPTDILDPDSPGLPRDSSGISIQATTLSATAPRVVWSVATAAVFLGLAALSFLAMIAAIRLKSVPFFSDDIAELVTIGKRVALVPAAGAVVRWSISGWVAGAYGEGYEPLVPGNSSSASPFDFLTFPLLCGAYFLVVYVWRQGRALQRLDDSVI